MIINSSIVAMYSSHSTLESSEYKDSLKMWLGDKRPDFQGVGSQNNSALDVKVNMSKASTEADTPPSTQDPEASVIQLSPELRLKAQLIEAMVEALTGKKIKLSLPEIINPNSVTVALSVPSQNTDANVPPKQGWGIEYDGHSSQSEAEATTFTGAGIIKTEDGKDIQFSASLTMGRKFMSENNISIRMGDAKKVDPLIINFGGSAAQLTDKKYSFDLNGDGKTEKISFVQPGSGFLALDKNGDGIINNGSELFGPQSGNGFSELAKYDTDGNGWIDEKDPVFSKLRILEKDANGNDTTSTLKEKNIGALYLGNVSAKFSVKDAQNSLMGETGNAGLYIREDGTAGTIQQVDLAI